MRSSAVLAALGAILFADLSAVPADGRKAPRPRSWQAVITPADHQRLRLWRDAWLLGLDQARAEGAGPAIAAEGALLDPDAGLADAEIPDGAYRCRVIKLGRPILDDQVAAGLAPASQAHGALATGGPAFASRDGFHCRIANGHFKKLDGDQRPVGMLWPMDGTRLIFLGAMVVGDESRALDYGRDDDRDMVGLIERIGPTRWRLVLPRPHWQSQIDIIELLRAGA